MQGRLPGKAGHANGSTTLRRLTTGEAIIRVDWGPGGGSCASETRAGGDNTVTTPLGGEQRPVSDSAEAVHFPSRLLFVRQLHPSPPLLSALLQMSEFFSSLFSLEGKTALITCVPFSSFLSLLPSPCSLELLQLTSLSMSACDFSGGTRGIGANLALTLAKSGADIILVQRSGKSRLSLLKIPSGFQ